jgi:hypothetical protein
LDKADFFISYNKADRQWAEWIAWQLEDSGYKTLFRRGISVLAAISRWICTRA